MLFLVDLKLKIIFGWSAKSGCSHIKKIFYFLQNNKLDNAIHINQEFNQDLPHDIENYNTIIFSRNPYKRIISGFLNKYNANGECRNLWKNESITFSKFVDELIKNDFKKVDKHHFTQQTSEKFNKDILLRSKCLTFYDIENIDYQYIESLYHKSIPNELINFKGPHKREKYNISFPQEKVYDLDINIYYNYDVSIEQFYNEEIILKIYYFYKNDFDFFKENGINYL